MSVGDCDNDAFAYATSISDKRKETKAGTVFWHSLSAGEVRSYNTTNRVQAPRNSSAAMAAALTEGGYG